MKLKTRLMWSALIMVVAPLVLTCITFILLGLYRFRHLYGETVLQPDMTYEFSAVTLQAFFVQLLFAITIILVITSLLITSQTYQSFAKPVWKLNEAMRQMAKGNLDYSIATDGTDELSELCNNFDVMRRAVKETMESKVRFDQDNRELVSNISHDLKTPITSIKGYCEGIMDGVADTPEKMDRYIKTIYNKANEMDRLINELTLYSQIDTNRIPYNFHRIDVNDFFNDCVEEIGLDLESKNIKLTYSNYVESGTRIIADPEQLRRVINNIISNSVKYMDKPDGSIDICIVDNNDSIQVEIEDNGKGIAAKDLPNIFDRFFRTDASRNSAQGGSGIGLSIVRKIIEDHGGYIWATGKEGEGTTIHFVLRKYVEAEHEQNTDY
ncbi:MAG: HAMP domain-containing histidine kinase [Lachnospiraceae bacterium]|nr:HAMP domain-containing histidine kinase [Lachnospiraceae bacterium]